MALAEKDIPEGIRDNVTPERLQLCLGRIVVVRKRTQEGYLIFVGLLNQLDVKLNQGEEGVETYWHGVVECGNHNVTISNGPNCDEVEYIYVAGEISSMIEEFKGEIPGENSY